MYVVTFFYERVLVFFGRSKGKFWVHKPHSNLTKLWFGMAWQLCEQLHRSYKYERILLLEEQMGEKHCSILRSPLLFHFSILFWRKMILVQRSYNKKT